MKTATPIGMLYRDTVEIKERGYTPLPEKWDYDPTTQVSSLIKMGGPSHPTTRSLVSGTTGTFGRDSDEANDDRGTD